MSTRQNLVRPSVEGIKIWQESIAMESNVGLDNAPRAVYYQASGATYNTLLAVRNSHSDDQGEVYTLRDGSVQGTSLSFGQFLGTPFLLDLGGDHIALIYVTGDGVPTIRKMGKRTSQWSEPYQPFPPMVNCQYSWHGSPNGAVNLEVNSSGEDDRVFYLFWGYSFYAWYMDQSDARWMKSDIENLGPEGD